MTDELNTLELECGIVLELQAVNDMLLLDLMESIKPDRDGKFTVQGMPVRDLNRMMRFLCGWGVKNDVPHDKLNEVAIFGSGIHLQRSVWVRMVATLPELTQIFAQVMALTQIKSRPIAQPAPVSSEREQAKLTAKELFAMAEEQGLLDEIRAKIEARVEDGKH